MISIGHYRRAYFALLKRCAEPLGFDPGDKEARHEWNADLVGRASTRQWDEKQWAYAVSILQIVSGRDGVEPGHPHLRGGKPTADEPGGLGNDATLTQQHYIRDLADDITWRLDDGLERLIRARVLDDDRVWIGGLDVLTRIEASLTIRILVRMRRGQQRRLAEAVA